MPPNTPREVARANAILERLAAQSPIHGALRASNWPDPYPLITAGLHCTACELNVGGALDLSGEVGPTDGEGAVRQLLELLSARGCTHAASFEISPDRDRDPQESPGRSAAPGRPRAPADLRDPQTMGEPAGRRQWKLGNRASLRRISESAERTSAGST